MTSTIEDRVARLERTVSDLVGHIRSAIAYSPADPASALTKSRIVLEKLLLDLYVLTGHQAFKVRINDILCDKSFTVPHVPPRILARMRFVQDLGNLGPHPSNVNSADSALLLEVLVDIVEWYVLLRSQLSVTTSAITSSVSADLLEDLRAIYPGQLRPEIKSVRLVQSRDACVLEITTQDSPEPYSNEHIAKQILGISNSESAFLSPSSDLAQNVRTFLSEFDAISIAMCTDLFTVAAADAAYNRWREDQDAPASPNSQSS